MRQCHQCELFGLQCGCLHSLTFARKAGEAAVFGQHRAVRRCVQPPITTSASHTGTNGLLDRKVAERSMLIKNMIEDLGSPGEEAIPIMNVSAPVSAHCKTLTCLPAKR